MSEGKKCRDCGLVKPASEYWKRKASPDGLALYCRECFGLRNATRYRRKRAAEGKEARPYRRHSAVPEGMKYCARCEEVKPVDAFGSNRSQPDGRTTYCRPCHNRVVVENKTRNHGSVRSYLLKLRYGITEAEMKVLRERQGGICVICLGSPAVHVDHSHLTGLVRGMLCFRCNGGLGQFEDDVWRVKEAADYLECLTWFARVMMLEFGVEVIDGRARGSRRPVVDLDRRERHYRVGRRYGIGEPDVRRLVELQNGRCAICCDGPAENVDHCHATGVVRGMLCGGCNTGMGQLRDDPGVLRRAVAYLSGTLVTEVPVAGGGSRLSFTVPDVDPGSVPLDGWDGYRERDAVFRRELRDAEWGDRESWVALPGEERFPLA
ncbi:endonuclease VII domain-containing protein [Spirillospora sp. NPDC127200]